MLLAYKSPVKTWLTGRDAFVFAVLGARTEPSLQGASPFNCHNSTRGPGLNTVFDDFRRFNKSDTVKLAGSIAWWIFVFL